MGDVVTECSRHDLGDTAGEVWEKHDETVIRQEVLSHRYSLHIEAGWRPSSKASGENHLLQQLPEVK